MFFSHIKNPTRITWLLFQNSVFSEKKKTFTQKTIVQSKMIWSTYYKANDYKPNKKKMQFCIAIIDCCCLLTPTKISCNFSTKKTWIPKFGATHHIYIIDFPQFIFSTTKEKWLVVHWCNCIQRIICWNEEKYWIDNTKWSTIVVRKWKIVRW